MRGMTTEGSCRRSFQISTVRSRTCPAVSCDRPARSAMASTGSFSLTSLTASPPPLAANSPTTRLVRPRSCASAACTAARPASPSQSFRYCPCSGGSLSRPRLRKSLIGRKQPCAELNVRGPSAPRGRRRSDSAARSRPIGLTTTRVPSEAGRRACSTRHPAPIRRGGRSAGTFRVAVAPSPSAHAGRLSPVTQIPISRAAYNRSLDRGCVPVAAQGLDNPPGRRQAPAATQAFRTQTCAGGAIGARRSRG